MVDHHGGWRASYIQTCFWQSGWGPERSGRFVELFFQAPLALDLHLSPT